MRTRRTITRISLLICFGGLLVVYFFRCGKGTGDWKPAESPLMTRWGKRVSPKNVLPEYPRPQMVRKDWMNLNGLWDFALLNKDENHPEEYAEKILVPFPVESALSGVGKRVSENERVWYRRMFIIPSGWRGKRILLHFGAVDWESAVIVNGEKLGVHRGGYDGFSFDITESLRDDSPQELVVSAWDPTDLGGQAVGKQRKNPRGIFYTSTTGIWQTVWLEPVTDAYIASFEIDPDVDGSILRLKVKVTGNTENAKIEAVAMDGGTKVAEASGKPGQSIALRIPEAKLWSPESPFLYDLTLALKDGGSSTRDEVKSYFAMRKIGLGKDEKGITRLQLNNAFVFQLGPLDQGFWPDGLYMAPSDDALRYDIEMMKEMGFNMVRKHVKVEPDRWYYWCDKLGLLVWQDMPNAKNATDADKRQFEKELERVIRGLYNHPSIVMWVPFNEGWGQYDSERITEWIRELDASRLVNHASGWTDMGVSDVVDIHSYPDPKSPEPEPERAAVLGEFGGLGFNIAGHAWNTEGWGYDLLQDPESLAKRYENLYQQLLPFIDKPGLSAAVYTQITDIESENNGLMTYDREICKIDAQTIALAHAGYLPPRLSNDARIFIDLYDAALSTFRPDASIYYTLDGSEPTEKSQRYDGSFSVGETTILKAKAFWKDGKASRMSGYELTKVLPRESTAVAHRKPGLKAFYYEGDWETLPDFSVLTPKLSKIYPKVDLGAAESETHFALRFEGYIDIPETGVYVFYASSDDGSKILIGDEVVVDNDGLHGMMEKQGAASLKAGLHPLTVLFFQRTGERGLSISYEGPGIKKQEIPAAVLFHE
ncbi:MAG: PA14 domain-containing protein [bacterium]